MINNGVTKEVCQGGGKLFPKFVAFLPSNLGEVQKSKVSTKDSLNSFIILLHLGG